jgi:hypothetical protein
MLADTRYDFIRFAQLQLSTRDIDPAYPVLKSAFDAEAIDTETRLWRLVLYLTYYNLTSAAEAWTRTPQPSLEGIDALPTGIERRGMRGNPEAVRKFIKSLLDKRRQCGSLEKWIERDFGMIPSRSWRRIRESMETCWGAGSWASYKWADLLKNVMQYPITADDIGLGGGSTTAGPVPGLALLTGEPVEKCFKDVALQVKTYEEMRLHVPFEGLEEFETALCDFNSLSKGNYYVGHDIDQMAERLPEGSIFWAARRASLPNQCLGEIQGWSGVRKELKSLYLNNRVIFGG